MARLFQHLEDLPKGPFTSTYQKYVAISRLIQFNETRRDAKLPEVTNEEYSEYSGIPLDDINDAPANREFIEVTRSMAKANFNLWLHTQLPHLQSAAERLSKNQAKDKEYVQLILQIAEITNFKAVDFTNLKPREEKNSEEKIREVLTLLEPLCGEFSTPQKIIERLASDPGRETSKKDSEEAVEASRPD